MVVNKRVNNVNYYHYNKGKLKGIISKEYKTQGTTIINAITIGNKTVQQNDIS
jgi:calcineurin-like phosphoesterase